MYQWRQGSDIYLEDIGFESRLNKEVGPVVKLLRGLRIPSIIKSEPTGLVATVRDQYRLGRLPTNRICLINIKSYWFCESDCRSSRSLCFFIRGRKFSYYCRNIQKGNYNQQNRSSKICDLRKFNRISGDKPLLYYTWPKLYASEQFTT